MKIFFLSSRRRVMIVAINTLLGILAPYQIAQCNEISSTEIEAGVSLLNFGYKEFNTNNVLWDKEDGVIPGLTFAVTHHWQQWSANLKLTKNKGVVDYTGNTQGGTPITTKTDTKITDYSLNINRWVTTQNNIHFAIYLGYGQHTWHRYIRSTFLNNGMPVSGLNEKYYWDYAQAGTKIELINNSKTNWMIDVEINYMLNADIKVDFKGLKNIDPISLELGKKWGLRLSSPYKINFQNQLSFKINPFYEYWEISRSESKQLSINGLLINSFVAEPRSETENFGINLAIVKKF